MFTPFCCISSPFPAESVKILNVGTFESVSYIDKLCGGAAVPMPTFPLKVAPLPVILPPISASPVTKSLESVPMFPDAYPSPVMVFGVTFMVSTTPFVLFIVLLEMIFAIII